MAFLAAILQFAKAQWKEIGGAAIVIILFLFIRGKLAKGRMKKELEVLMEEKNVIEGAISENKKKHSKSKYVLSARLEALNEELTGVNEGINRVQRGLGMIRREEEAELKVQNANEAKLKRKITKEEMLDAERAVRREERQEAIRKAVAEAAQKFDETARKVGKGLRKVDREIGRKIGESKKPTPKERRREREVLLMVSKGMRLFRAKKKKQAVKAYDEARGKYRDLGWRGKSRVEPSVMEFYKALLEDRELEKEKKASRKKAAEMRGKAREKARKKAGKK